MPRTHQSKEHESCLQGAHLIRESNETHSCHGESHAPFAREDGEEDRGDFKYENPGRSQVEVTELVLMNVEGSSSGCGGRIG